MNDYDGLALTATTHPCRTTLDKQTGTLTLIAGICKSTSQRRKSEGTRALVATNSRPTSKIKRGSLS